MTRNTRCAFLKVDSLRLFIFVVVLVILIALRDLFKANLCTMFDFLDSMKLFSMIMWVLLVGLLWGCQLENELPELPLEHRQTNWMDVLHDLPMDKNRAKQLDHLIGADSVFWAQWSEDILQLGSAADTNTVDVVHRFMTEMEPMLLAIDTTSGSTLALQRQSDLLMQGFRRWLQLSPSAEIPDVIWMPSGFNFAVYPGDTWLAIGLDWFMGAEHSLYRELPPSKFPTYRLARMKTEWMATDAFKGWFAVHHQSMIPNSPSTSDMWLYWGKVMSLTAQCFPEASPAQLMNWTEKEWAWAIEHEQAIWREMQPQDQLFSKNPRDIMRWFQEGPFTRVGRIPQESPDRLGVFLGWRAVEAAKAQHPEWEPHALVQMMEVEPFLQAYRP